MQNLMVVAVDSKVLMLPQTLRVVVAVVLVALVSLQPYIQQAKTVVILLTLILVLQLIPVQLVAVAPVHQLSLEAMQNGVALVVVQEGVALPL
jgi:hypothetical protein